MYDQPLKDGIPILPEQKFMDKKTKLANKSKLVQIQDALRVSVHEKPGYIIGTLYAEDADAGNNGLVFYLIKEMYEPGKKSIKTNSLIRVHSDSGNLIILRSMTLNDLGYHLFRVTASDRGHPKMRIEKKVT